MNTRYVSFAMSGVFLAMAILALILGGSLELVWFCLIASLIKGAEVNILTAIDKTRQGR